MGIHDRPYYRDDEFTSNLAPSWNQKSAISTLIIANVVIFLAEVFTPRTFSLQNFLSLSTDDLQQPWMLWRSLSYGFTHATNNPFHIAGNMLGLWFLGRIVEYHYGKAEFFRAYLFSVVVCGMLFVVLRSALDQPAIVCGASGAVSFVTMLFILNFPYQILMLFGVVPVQAWVLGVFLIAYNLFYGSGAGVSVDNKSSIAWDVHLFGIGLAFAYYYGNWNFGVIPNPLQSWKSLRRKLWGPKLHAFRGEEDISSEEAEADRILDKIHQLGKDSLTSKEQKFLTNYSQRIRKKREESSL